MKINNEKHAHRINAYPNIEPNPMFIPPKAKVETNNEKHAHWINAYPDIEPNPMFMYGICSNCGFEQSMSSDLKYCPGCGSKMDEEKMSYEELEADRDDYKKRFKEMVELTHKLKNAFLGEGYYIGCSCGEPQASEIIIEEIIEKFAPKQEKPNKNWIFNRFGQR